MHGLHLEYAYICAAASAADEEQDNTLAEGRTAQAAADLEDIS